MIQSFRHKGLRRFLETGSTAGISPQFARRLGMILAVLNRAVEIRDMDLPGFRLHPLRGRRRGIWSVWVSGNWRVTFRFESGEAFNVNLEDYH
jgi:proteic killer suppression protein